MTLFGLLFFSFLPLCALFAYCAFSRKCPLFSALCAVLFAVPAIALSSLAQTLLSPVSSRFSGWGALFFSSLIEAALIEELVKALFVSLIPGIRKRALSVRQVLVLSLVLAFSFSAFETLSYSVRFPSALWLRPLTALPVHACATMAGGAWIASVYRGSSSGSAENRAYAILFACAVFLHGLFNACMERSGFLIVPAVGCVLALLAIAWFVWKKTGGALTGEVGE